MSQWSVRRLKAIIASLLTFLIVVSSILAWVSYERQVETWKWEAVMLREMAGDFQAVSRLTQNFMETSDIDWASEAVSRLGRAAAFFLPGSPGEYSRTAKALNLTWRNLAKLHDAYAKVWQDVYWTPGPLNESSEIWAFLETVKTSSLLISDLLEDVRPDGTDPLVQLGDERISTIREAMGELCRVSDMFEHFYDCD